ncbi:MAG: glycosyl transferase, partial [Planctomycetes bacterium]|nr:glycosyl transferase [Planctomycetota bacterium]
VCSDGGAMHVAAALGKPIVCFFGNSDATLWRPWGVPHALLQPASRDVADVGVDQALAAFDSLGGRLRAG